jgi:protein-S-isoprenylcysteine O-methyltransferase Ste14
MWILVIILIAVFLINFITYWIIELKQKNISNKTKEFYKKSFPFIWTISIFLIPIINSSFLQSFFNENISYFHQYWIWFVLAGIVIIIFGLKVRSSAIKSLKKRTNTEEKPILMKKGVYEIARHPKYLSWIFIYMGITFISDSFLAVIFCPLLVILTELLCFLEEKHILIPKFGENYIKYKEKTPYRLVSPPYNCLLIILAIIIIYIGFINLYNIF